MRVFVTGATGFVGTAVVQELIAAGHEVLGLARTEAAAKAVAAAGAEAHRGSLEDAESLRRGAKGAEGVIHAAFIHDFGKMAAAAETDKLAIETLGAVLAGSNRPFVVTSAIGLLASGRIGTEADAPDSNSGGAHRIASEEAALALASRGVRVSVVRLPSSVHGEGDHGFVPALIRIAREKGVSAYIGDGSNRWAAVHKKDAAAVFRLALEKGPAGTRFHAVGDEGVRTRELAEAIGRGLALPVVSKPLAQAAEHFTWLARFFTGDVPASSARTQQQLGWQPRELGLLADLAHGHYFKT
jgi:nucleoside-diphosphate-sugar epimerase